MNRKQFAYIRVSSKDQNHDRQLIAIQEYAKEKGLTIDERDIFIDKQSGKDFNRPAYQALKLMLRRGDTLIVKELDRLGRNMCEIKREWSELAAAGVDIEIIEMPILNASNKTDLEKQLIANIVFELLAYLAQKEWEKKKVRQEEGIAAAKARGQRLGRPAINKETLTTKQRNLVKANYDRWIAGEITATDFMKLLDLKRNTFYKIMAELKAEGVK